jgi:hypothetical protein
MEFSLALHDSLYQALLRRSEEEGRSPSDLIASLLEEAIAEGWRPSSDRPTLSVTSGSTPPEGGA